jgi:RNA polymerase sigma-70 factor (ECF subfamily)
VTDARAQVERVWREESRRVLATLVRLVGDLELAEDALQAAFVAALEDWPRDGVPANPRAWLVSTGRHKALDSLRRRQRLDGTLSTLPERLEHEPEVTHDDELADDRLRLVFACCHPALAPEARLALTLREVCGLGTEEIARAFLTSAPTIAQRIVRAKARLREERVPFEPPSRAELPARLDAVLHVIYLVFNEGYSATSGEGVVRADLCSEAIRLGRLVAQLLAEPEVQGLLALMLLHDSRREARTSSDGELVLLDDQDRSLWRRAQIVEGVKLVESAIATRRFGAYTLQAAIAAVHAEAATPAATDWAEIVALYELLLTLTPSPVVELNLAVALAMRDGPAAGLERIERLLARGELRDYPHSHAAHADLLRKLGRRDEARAAYERALALSKQEQERRFLAGRLRDL